MPGNSGVQRPWLVAVWPGMGHVASAAGYYLLAKLGMNLYSEFTPHELFEVEHVEVERGLIRMGRMPRSRIFLWKNPAGGRDLILFLGEAQPATGRYAFCHRLIEQAIAMDVERVFTFAAMATDMTPDADARVFGAATDEPGVDELRRLEIEVLEEGHIGGLNGVLLGAAAERGLRGTCLLGEMPHLFPQLPFPKASLAVLDVFATITGITLDLDELRTHARAVEQQLMQLMQKLTEAAQREQGETDDDEHPEGEDGEPTFGEAPEPEARRLGAEDEARIHRLFAEAAGDRSKAFELKAELDRLGVFADYEDRFLDLFKPPQ